MSIEFTFYDNSDVPPFTNEPETHGPFIDAQMTYAGLRVDDDHNLAHYDGLFWWVTVPQDAPPTWTRAFGPPEAGIVPRRFTDFVISHKEDE